MSQSLRNFAALMLQLLITVLGILTGLFLLLRLSGDPAVMIAGQDASQQTLQRIRAELELDQPLYVQYISFIRRTSQFDFGLSFHQRRPAMGLVLQRFPQTVVLALAAVVLATAVAIPLGILAAIRRGRAESHAIMLFAALGQAMPNFWLGILLILLFAVGLRWLPSFGSGDVRHAILPVVTLAVFQIARLSRMVRSEMLEVLSQDYIRTAYAKGLKVSVVLRRHALPNSLIPIVTLLSLNVSHLVSGAVVVETVFSYNGVGRLLVDAISNRDYPVVQAAVFFIALNVIVVNFLTDWVYRLVDPRIRS